MWNDRMILDALKGDPPIVYTPDLVEQRYGPIMERQVQPCSLDVRIGEEFIHHPSGERVELDEFFAFTLLPGECVLASVLERMNLPSHVAARIEGKSTWAREFLTVHSAGFIDAGFCGDITLELKNDGRKVLVLKPGDVIAQLSFLNLDAPAERPYGSPGLDSHYQGQEGATPSWRSVSSVGD
jgi:dCTP deaminase